MICPKCNYDNADNALFCANCGAKLEAPGPYAPAGQADPSAQLPVYGEQTPVYREPEQPAPSNSQSFPNYGAPASGGYGNYGGYGGGQPSYYGSAPRPGQDRDWAAIAALVCGIVSLPCCFTVYGGLIVAICAVVFGIIGIKSSKKAMAIVGLCLGAVGLICAILMVVSTLSLLSDPTFMSDFMTEFEDAIQL